MSLYDSLARYEGASGEGRCDASLYEQKGGEPTATLPAGGKRGLGVWLMICMSAKGGHQQWVHEFCAD